MEIFESYKKNGYVKIKSLPPSYKKLRNTIFEMLKISYKKNIGPLKFKTPLSIQDAAYVFIELEKKIMNISLKFLIIFVLLIRSYN